MRCFESGRDESRGFVTFRKCCGKPRDLCFIGSNSPKSQLDRLETSRSSRGTKGKSRTCGVRTQVSECAGACAYLLLLSRKGFFRVGACFLCLFGHEWFEAKISRERLGTILEKHFGRRSIGALYRLDRKRSGIRRRYTRVSRVDILSCAGVLSIPRLLRPPRRAQLAKLAKASFPASNHRFASLFRGLVSEVSLSDDGWSCEEKRPSTLFCETRLELSLSLCSSSRDSVPPTLFADLARPAARCSCARSRSTERLARRPFEYTRTPIWRVCTRECVVGDRRVRVSSVGFRKRLAPSFLQVRVRDALRAGEGDGVPRTGSLLRAVLGLSVHFGSLDRSRVYDRALLPKSLCVASTTARVSKDRTTKVHLQSERVKALTRALRDANLHIPFSRCGADDGLYGRDGRRLRDFAAVLVSVVSRSGEGPKRRPGLCFVTRTGLCASLRTRGHFGSLSLSLSLSLEMGETHAP